MATRGAAILACAAALAAVAVAPAGARPKQAFRPGLYVGRTSQAEAVRLKVVGCGTKQCLETPNEEAYFSVELSCPSSGQTEEEIVDLSASTIARNGTVEGSVGPSPGATENRSTEKFKVARNGTLTGIVNVSETLETGTRCATGKVTLEQALEAPASERMPRSSRRRRRAAKSRAMGADGARGASPPSGGKRAARGARREELMATIKANPGASAADLAVTIGIRPTQVYALVAKAKAERLIVRDGDGYRLKGN